jgi:hypothetical protein
MVEDVDIGETHAFQALVEAGEHVLAGTEIPVGAGPHVPSGFGGDDKFIAVGTKIFFENLAKGFFGGSVGRAIVVGEIEVSDAEVEGAAEHGASVFEIIVATEVVPEAERDGGKLDAAASAAAILHGVVTVGGGDVHTIVVPRIWLSLYDGLF